MKKNRSRLPLSILAILLLFTLISSLSSCTAGSEQIFSKEELSANIENESVNDLEYAYEYLDRWCFPAFSAGKLKRVENLFKKHFYKDLPDALTLASKTARTFLDSYYSKIDLTDTTAVSDALLYSYVSSIGDRYSFYRTGSQYQSYTENLSGTFVGIGVKVSNTVTENGGITVVLPINGSPAYEAGIAVGDVIVSIDGVLVKDVGYDAAVELIKGKEGTEVSIGIMRDGAPISFTVKRSSVIDSSVSYYVDESNIGYIDIDSFKANTDELFIEALEHMESVGVDAIIYDLRDNGGGYLDTVLNMLDYIAPDGITLASYSNDYDDPDESGDGHSLFIPSVLICNGNTASAAELFIAGIRDIGEMGYYEVTIVGETTYGKGVMQTSYTLSDKSAITLTVAYYYPPSGVCYDGIGIPCDVEVKKNSDRLAVAFEEARLLTINN